jgi:hypothetical protein
LIEVEGEAPSDRAGLVEPPARPDRPRAPDHPDGGVFEEEPTPRPEPGGGLFEEGDARPDDGGGLFEDEPAGPTPAAVALGREVRAKVADAYYGWHRHPNRTYSAACRLETDAQRPLAELVATSALGLCAPRVLDSAGRDAELLLHDLEWGWKLPMTGPLARAGAPPVKWYAARTGYGYQLLGLAADGATMETVTVANDFTVTKRIVHFPDDGQDVSRLQFSFTAAKAEGLLFLKRIDVREESGAGRPLGQRSFTFTYRHVEGLPFLKRIAVDVERDGQKARGDVLIVEVTLGP